MSRGLVPAAATVLLALILIHAGTTIPDTDQWLPVLGHRSAVHSQKPWKLQAGKGIIAQRNRQTAAAAP